MAESNAERDLREQLRQARSELEQCLRAGQACRAEQIFARYPALAADADSALEIIYSTEFTLRELRDEGPTPQEYYARFPQYRQGLEELFRLHKVVDGEEEDLDSPDRLDLPVEGGTDWGVEHFEVLEPLGQHDAVVVFKARQLSRDRLVAVKMVAKKQTPPEELARFRRGRDDQARLRHPNIVQVYDRGEDEDDVFFTMEFGTGGTLAQRIADRPLPADEAARILNALAGAIQHAHDQKIIHRDLKPANVVLTADGTPKITDFGLAKRLETGSGPTRTGHLLGTPPYMAPEQAAGQAEIDERADIYGLGAVLYEMLTGRPPFQGKNELETLFQVRWCRVVLPRRHNRSVDRRLESICLKCLEKRPRRRYPVARALADDLESWQRRRRPRAHRLSARLGRFVRRRPAESAAVGLLMLAGILVPLIAYLRHPIRELEQIQRQLAAGHAVTLISDTGPPRWSHYQAGRATARASAASDEPFFLTTHQTILLELLPDPNRQRYRFTAEVRHNNSYNPNGEVGIYFAHSRHGTAQGEQHCFCTLTFDDRHSKDARRAPNVAVKSNPVALDLRRYSEPNPGPYRNLSTRVLSQYFTPAVPSKGAGPWRQLAVEVTPEKIRFRWERGSWSEPLSRQELRKRAGEILAHSQDPTDLQPEFAPEEALGLFVSSGSASFRQVVVEPLGDE
ncbi:MAG TPA: serine/threonine-protein kinase [Gemmataceae bacterium]|nr:serine/threonine-protein kinase [Gemmataceae bacterium]